MLELNTLVVGELKTNCYLLVDKDNLNCIVIDPGGDSEYIKDYIQRNNYIPLKILLTHGHFDHVLAAAELQMIYDVKIYMSGKDAFLIKRLKSTAEYYLGIKDALKPQNIEFIDKKDKFRFSRNNISIMETPGHTPGGLTYCVRKKRLIFPGDTIFKGGGIGRYDFRYSDKSELIKSINKLKGLPKNYTVYPGHGESFMLIDFFENININ